MKHWFIEYLNFIPLDYFVYPMVQGVKTGFQIINSIFKILIFLLLTH
jgi:hypothetical protein